MDQPTTPLPVALRDSTARRAAWLEHAARLAGMFSIAVGATVLVGWSLGLESITRIRPQLPFMPKVAALAFVLAGLGLIALLHVERRMIQRLGKMCAWLLLTIGTTVILGHLAGPSLAIGGTAPGAAAGLWAEAMLLPNLTALAYVLLGTALLLLDSETRRGWQPAQWLALATFALALLPALGYSFGSTSLAGVEPLSRTALHGAVTLLVLAVGVLFARPERGAMALFIADDAGAAIARRLIPIAVGLPAAVGMLQLFGERAGNYDSAFGAAIITAIEIFVLTAVIFSYARSVQRADRARQMEEKRFWTLLESAPDAMLLSDTDGRIVLVNARAEALFGFDRAQLLGRSIELLVPAMQRGQHQQLRQHYQRSPQITPMGKNRELTAQHRDGSTIPVEISLSPIHAESGLCILSTVRDISERKLQEQRLFRLNRMHAVLSGVNTLIVRASIRQQLFEETCRIAVDIGRFGAAWIDDIDHEQRTLYPVAWAGELADPVLGDSQPVRLGRAEDDGLIPQAVASRRAAYSNDILTLPVLSEHARRVIEHGYRSVIALPLLANGEVCACLTLVARERDYFDADELGLLNELAEDVSFALEHIAQQEQIDFLARFDPLTGLANRALFGQRLTESAQRDGEAPALVLLCVARFRLINDSFGRATGDRLLALIGQRLAGSVPEPSLLARVEADRFAFLITDCAVPATLAASVRTILDDCFGVAFECHGHEIRLIAQAGIAIAKGRNPDTDALLRDAQAALRDAKNSAERVAFHAPGMNSEVAAMVALENRLRVAIERQQFVLHYQPKYDARSGTITGVEALIRWQDPERGLVLPATFIDLLEDTGLIFEVGTWVMQQAVSDYRRWCDLGLRAPRVAVNVSALQLQQDEFAENVRAVLTAGGDGRHGLDLEITESVLMNRVERNVGVLGELRALGVGIAIDDFGTGYSSLLYLARLPLDTLKIDRSFITAMTSKPADLTIVSTIVSMAHQLGLKVVAEGVDAGEQANLLRAMHCDQLQGFLFSAALPAEQLEALLRNGA
ncbi:MAG: EAL domain-containing protein [Lysobacterales bacterium]